MTESPSPPDVEGHPEFRYHLLRAAAERFGAGIPDLDGAQRAEATRLARRTWELEELVLASPEARALTIPAGRLDAALEQVRERYADREAWIQDLARNGLDPATLRAGLDRELVFDGTMQRVGARHAPVGELEERLFFECQQERFLVPERRTACHILITVNDQFAENRREAARARIDGLLGQLLAPAADSAGTRARRFADLARQHSECPTAVEGGRLGDLVRGRLYPALDAALFALGAGEIGGPLESELGFHLLYCERVQPGRAIPFDEARPQIRQLLEERARNRCQRDWINGLRGATAGAPASPRR